MRAYQQTLGILAGSAIALVSAQAAHAAGMQIVDVQIERGTGEFQILLQTAGNNAQPEVMTVNQGQSLVADILDSQLQVNGNTTGFKTENPVPGIASVELRQTTPDTVRLIVTGTEQIPVGRVSQQDGRIAFDFTSNTPTRNSAQLPTTLPPTPPDDGVAIAVQPAPAPITVDPNAATAAPAVVPTTPTEPSSSIFQLDPNAFQVAQNTPRSEVLVPDPTITVQGAPAVPAAPIQPNTPAPSFLPRAVPPPVGDIAVAPIGINAPTVDLGSSLPVFMRIDDAEVGTVLQSLASLADMNVILGGAATAADGAGADAGGIASRISVDLQGESLQDAFNYVLQMSGLDATRKGRTILIGSRLPASAKNLVTRTFRINQAEAATVATYMATQGAEVQTIFQEIQTTTDENTGDITRDVQAPQVTSIGPDAGNDAYLPLRGLSVSSDERLNTVTVTGEQRLVELATNFIQQLDARVRQVAVNVKIIDVNLQNIGRFGTSFSFGINNAGVINQGGIGIINFGDGGTQTTPIFTDAVSTTVGAGVNGTVGAQPFTDPGDFIAQLQATIENNNAKILTDPTLVVQEGQSASVQLTQEVVTDVNVERDISDGVTTITVTTETEEVGLTLGVAVNRIDDNGFISMIVTPNVSAVGNTQTINNGVANNVIALVNRRTLESGVIRMRDGQTLVLSGIIQDQDTVATAKLPLLGDLPIIGALFRRTTRTNERREVIVLVTPNLIDDTQPYGYSYVRQGDQPQLPQMQ